MFLYLLLCMCCVLTSLSGTDAQQDLVREPAEDHAWGARDAGNARTSRHGPVVCYNSVLCEKRQWHRGSHDCRLVTVLGLQLRNPSLMMFLVEMCNCHVVFKIFVTIQSFLLVMCLHHFLLGFTPYHFSATLTCTYLATLCCAGFFIFIGGCSNQGCFSAFDICSEMLLLKILIRDGCQHLLSESA